MEKLIEQFKRIAPLSPELEAHIRSILKPRLVARKETILHSGDIAKHIYFIEKGLVRSFYYLQDDDEVTNWFMKEDDIFISVQSFFRQEPSFETIEAMEDCILWGITYHELQQAYRSYIEFNVHRGSILEHYYALSDRRNTMTKKQPMLQRYENLIREEPHLLQRVPSKYLAGYLGMNESTFSITRRQYLQQLKKKKK